MANFPTSPATGTIFSTAQNVYKYNGTAWESISPNISLGYPEMTGSFIDLSGSLPNLVNVGASTISNITASVLHLDGTFSSGSNIAIPITGSAVKLRTETGYIDPENLVLELNFDGPDGSTTFTDSSISNHTVTATNAVIKDAVSVFRSSSAYFDGGDYLTMADSDDWSFGADPFTIEFWAYPTSIATTWQTLGFMSSGTEAILLGFEVASGQDYGFFIDINNGGTYNATPGSKTGKTGISNNSWYHVAFVRDGTELRTYLNGVLKNTYVIGTTAVNNPTGDFTIGGPAGSSGATNDFRGYYDRFRIYKGVAKFTSNFDVGSNPDSYLPTNHPILKIENKYNNLLKEYKVDMTSDDTRIALTGSY